MPAAALCAVVVLALAALLPGRAWAVPPGPLLLQPALDQQAAWPHVRLLAEDGTHPDTAAQLLQQLGRFQPPAGPPANLGTLHGAVWLHLQVRAPAGAPRPWLLDIDNPSLDRVDLFVGVQGRVLAQSAMGDTLPVDARAWPSRSLTAPLSLPPGQTVDLLLRVQSTGTVLLPVVLMQPAAWQARESRVQALQGLMAGVGLCLLVYSLLQWVGTRDRMFAWYALSLAGVTGFFIAYHGLGNQHLWGELGWMSQNGALLFGLVALFGSCLFADRALQMPATSPVASRLMRGLAGVLLLALLAWLAGLLPYHAVHLLITLLGAVPMLVALPVVVLRMRQGDVAARYMLLGWAAYGAGVLILSATLRGLLPVNLYTQYVFQLSAMVEMLMWMAVLGTRTAELRRAAAQARSERSQLDTLAHTDALTGALNRRALLRHGDALVQTAAPGRHVAVCMIDLDGFKAVNDQHGHAAGDALLQQLAQRLRRVLRSTDQVVRTGGDEFVVVAAGLQSPAEADAVAAKLLQAAAQPFLLAPAPGPVQCQVGLSVGYALAPDDATALPLLMAYADAAMYTAKAAGKNRAVRTSGAAGGSGMPNTPGTPAAAQPLRA